MSHLPSSADCRFSVTYTFILVLVWAHLQNWIVQDGEIPELHGGAALRDHALRAACWSIEESSGPEGCTELPGRDPSGDDAPHYELTGTVEWGQEPSSVLLRVGAFQVLAEPQTVRRVPGTSRRDFALERYSPDFFVPAPGARVSVICRLEVMAAYESEDGFGHADIRRDWLVRHLKIQRRPFVPVSWHEAEFNLGKVARVDSIERMHAWADEDGDDHVTYLLDLQP